VKAIQIYFSRALILCCALLVQSLAFNTSAQISEKSFQAIPTPIGVINDGYVNVNPMFSEDGKSLYFSKEDHPSNVSGNGDMDVWKAVLRNGKWELVNKAKLSLNTVSNELVIGTGGSDLVYVLRYSKGETESLTALHAYKIIGDSLVKHHFISIPYLEKFSGYFGFFVAPDESYVLFSMKGSFTLGKEDLYVILRKGEGWSEAIHLGAAVNSANFEMSPFMTRDSKYLFFASDGHKGFGDADLFFSERLDNSWTKWSRPVNLGDKVNGTGLDAYLTLNEESRKIAFVSERAGKSGTVYEMPYVTDASLEAKPETPHLMATGFVKLKKLPAMRIKLNLMDENDEVLQSVMTSDDGYFNIESFLPDRNYKIAIDDSLRTELKDADIFLTNKMDEKMVFLNEKELGIFGFKVLSDKKVGELKELEGLATKGKIVDKSTKISGRVASSGTLNEKVSLTVLDQENKPVETIVTDDEGYFSFDTKSKEKSYFLSVDDQNPGLVDVYEIYLTNNSDDEDIVVTKTGQQLFGFQLLNDGESLGLELLPEEDSSMPESILSKYGLIQTKNNSNLAGYLELSKLPIMDAEILLLDENDNVLGSTKTNIDGRFEFENLIGEGKYTLKLGEEQEKKLRKSEIFLAKNITDVVYYINEENTGVFAFQKMAHPTSKTLSLLKEEAEQGRIVNEKTTSIKGKFQYKKLPKEGVRLKLMDERENTIQVVDVDDNGEFYFENYTVNKNYFIAVEGGEGLSEIYEIYISGEKKNVLVNSTNRSVYSFKVLPSQAVMLTNSFEEDPELTDVISPKANDNGSVKLDGLISETYLGDKQAYFEFDISILQKTDFVSLQRVASKAQEGFGIIVRFSHELVLNNGEVELLPVNVQEAEEARDALVKRGIDGSTIKVKANGRDQVIMRVN
jgi:hypothetical protein